MNEDKKLALENNSFVLIWACGNHRVPLEVSQIGGAGDSWHIFGGGYEIITLCPDSTGGIYYTGNDYLFEDILALVDVIAQVTGISYNEVFITPDKYPSNICRYPPYFEPIFRSKQQEVSFYRMKWQLAKKDLELQSERELKVAWRR